MNKRCERHIHILTGAASWETPLRRCSATKRPDLKHGSNAKAERHYIGYGILLWFCLNDRFIPG
jgi:hypothetical protein